MSNHKDMSLEELKDREEKLKGDLATAFAALENAQECLPSEVGRLAASASAILRELGNVQRTISIRELMRSSQMS